MRIISCPLTFSIPSSPGEKRTQINAKLSAGISPIAGLTEKIDFGSEKWKMKIGNDRKE